MITSWKSMSDELDYKSLYLEEKCLRQKSEHLKGEFSADLENHNVETKLYHEYVNKKDDIMVSKRA